MMIGEWGWKQQKQDFGYSKAGPQPIEIVGSGIPRAGIPLIWRGKWVPNIKALKKMYGKQREDYVEQRAEAISRLKKYQTYLQETRGQIGRTRLRYTPEQLRPGQKAYLSYGKRAKLQERFRQERQRQLRVIQKRQAKTRESLASVGERTPKKAFGF